MAEYFVKYSVELAVCLKYGTVFSSSDMRLPGQYPFYHESNSL